MPGRTESVKKRRFPAPHTPGRTETRGDRPFSLTEPLVATAAGGRREGFCKSLLLFQNGFHFSIHTNHELRVRNGRTRVTVRVVPSLAQRHAAHGAATKVSAANSQGMLVHPPPRSASTKTEFIWAIGQFSGPAHDGEAGPTRSAALTPAPAPLSLRGLGLRSGRAYGGNTAPARSACAQTERRPVAARFGRGPEPSRSVHGACDNAVRTPI
jgi:hypothetical protein